MNFDDLDLALKDLYGKIATIMLRIISSKYQTADTYDAVARAFDDKAVRDDDNSLKSKALHDMILDQWKMLSDSEKYIILRYIKDVKGEDKYLGYNDVDDNLSLQSWNSSMIMF